MTNSSRVEQDCIEQIKISRVPISQRFSGMEEIRNGEVQSLGLLTEPYQFRCQIRKRTTEVFLGNEVVATKELWKVLLPLESDFHTYIKHGE